MAWVQSSPKGGIRQGYSTTTEFLRNSTVRPCREARTAPCRPGCCHGKKEGFGPPTTAPFFFRRSTSRGPSGLLEHPPKRVRQGKSRQARADPQGPQGGLVRPLWGWISSSRQRGGSP